MSESISCRLCVTVGTLGSGARKGERGVRESTTGVASVGGVGAAAGVRGWVRARGHD